MQPDIVGCDIAKARIWIFSTAASAVTLVTRRRRSRSGLLASTTELSKSFRGDGTLQRQAACDPEGCGAALFPRRSGACPGLCQGTRPACQDGSDRRVPAGTHGQSLPFPTQAPDDPARRVLGRLHAGRDQKSPCASRSECAATALALRTGHAGAGGRDILPVNYCRRFVGLAVSV